MEEKWIKIYEIEYTSDDLSKKYNEIKNNIEEPSINVEELVKENNLVKRLKENGIPYRCKWDEQESIEQYPRWYKSNIRKHFFVLIYIPESYDTKCQGIFNYRIEEAYQGIEELESTEEDEKAIYEPAEKFKKILKYIFIVYLLLALISIIYAIIQSI